MSGSDDGLLGQACVSASELVAGLMVPPLAEGATVEAVAVFVRCIDAPREPYWAMCATPDHLDEELLGALISRAAQVEGEFLAAWVDQPGR